MDSKKFTTEEMQAILQRAIERRSRLGEISYSDLSATAQELGIDEKELELAIREHLSGGGIEEARKQWLRNRKKKFYEHLRTYIIINSFLAGLNFFIGGGLWFIYPLLGWGIGLTFDAMSTFWPDENHVERGAQRLLRKQQSPKKHEFSINSGEIKAKSGKYSIDISSGKIIISNGDKHIEINGK
jgi:hypothetical protein